ncbi:MAG: TAXI family TRAP transporter solute-binding subunit [Pelagibacterium sp.]|uniref:TAXI family TRAP transporter solute-binding subunit n=1 Tax=Pelagibacterium sp. TaxID=1967288 RepID=UPI0032EEEFDF
MKQLFATTLAVASLTSGAAFAQSWDAAIGTHRVGSSYYSVGTALAALLSDNTTARAAVQPHSGPNAWMTALSNGEIAFGLASVVDTSWAFNGGPGYEEAVTNLRMLVNGGSQDFIGLATLEQSDVTSTADVAGKRVTVGFGGNFFSNALVEAHLASVGIDFDDIQSVPVPDTQTSIDMLRSGRADVSVGLTPTTPAIMDLNSARAVRPLSFGDLAMEDIAQGIPENMIDVLDEYLPGATLGVVEAGTGIVKDGLVSIRFDIQMVSTTEISNEHVYETTEAIWANYEQLHDSHPIGVWTPERMVPTSFNVPYHQGAVDFFEDEGIWTDEHQARQDELLSGIEG